MLVSEECIAVIELLVPIQLLWEIFSQFLHGQLWKIFLHGPATSTVRVPVGIQSLSLFTGF